MEPRGARAGAPWGRACGLASALHWWWFARGRLTEGRWWLERLLQRRRAAAPAPRARALVAAVYLACWQGDFAAARGPLEEGLGLARAAGDRRGIAFALHGLGHAAGGQGDHLLARARLEECLALAQDLRDAWLTAFALYFLGQGAYHLGEFALARSRYEAGNALYRQVGGHKIGVAYASIQLGRIARAQGDAAGARASFAAGVRLFQELGQRRGVAVSLVALAGTAAPGQGRRPHGCWGRRRPSRRRWASR